VDWFYLVHVRAEWQALKKTADGSENSVTSGKMSTG